MAKKLNSMPNFTAHMSKHPHDVSQSTTLTACPFMLQPVYYDMLHLGDELHFSASEFVRLNPLIAQPLGEIDVHLDYFFVPLTVLYLPSSSLFYETDDLVSSVFSQNMYTDDFPVFDFETFLRTNFPNGSVGNGVAGQSSILVSQTGAHGSIALPSGYFDCNGKSIYRIWDLLDMAPDTILDELSGVTKDEHDMAYYYPSYTPWYALAYQAIYQLYFRNDDREVKNYHYNIDDKYSTGSWSEDLTSGVLKSIFNLNYASRPKDYYNAVKVSPISSSVSLFGPRALQSMYSKVNEWLYNAPVITDTNTPAATSSTNAPLSDSTLTRIASVSGRASFTSASVRQMFMVEKLLRVVGRSEKNYESQFLAHYGIKIPHDVMHNITHIGHDMMTITPESVISQANTWDPEALKGSALGEIGGKGSGMLSGRKHNFKAPFHGVFMCISHIVPRRRYVLGLNKLHDLNTPAKFWQPEFDQKGMQPLFGYECEFGLEQPSMEQRKGWQFAYEQFKRKTDRTTHAFAPVRTVADSVNSYSPWVVNSYPFGFYTVNGVNNPTLGSLDAVSLLGSPNDLNVAMQVPHNTLWVSDAVGALSPFGYNNHKSWLLYQTDPFICDFNMYCKKVNMMSEYGEPEL